MAVLIALILKSQPPKTCAWHQALTSVHVQDDLAKMEMVFFARKAYRLLKLSDNIAIDYGPIYHCHSACTSRLCS